MGTIVLAGKRILVTGGTTGIGRATVALLAAGGGRLLTFGRHEPELADSLAHAREKANPDAVTGLVADAATREGILRIFDAVDRNLGGLDILINNAGVGIDPVQEGPDEAWRYGVETDFVAYLACSREAIKRMEAAGGGHIVFIGSISAEKESPGSSTYAAAKAGVRVYAETLRKEVAQKNIRVSWIEPGTIGADMQDMPPEEQRRKIAVHEMLYAEDVADAIEFVLTRPNRTDISALRIEPRLQKAD